MRRISTVNTCRLLTMKMQCTLAKINDSVRPPQAVVDNVERNAVKKALIVSEGNREKAARLLGIALRILSFKIKKDAL